MGAEDLSGTSAVVTGVSRGFGRAIAIALNALGANVVGIARDTERLHQLQAQLGDTFVGVAADAADPSVAGQMIDSYKPRTLVLNAGATPLPRPIQEHTWQTFTRNWEVDVQQVFHWTREALLAPLDPGSVVRILQRRCDRRVSPQWRLFGRQGHHPIHQLVCGRRVRASPARHQVRGGSAPAHAHHRSRRACRRRLRATRGCGRRPFPRALQPRPDPRPDGEPHRRHRR